MNINKLIQNGWITTALLGATVVFMGSHSESNSQKIASVDRAKMMQKSQYGAEKNRELEQKVQAIREFLTFLNNNKTVTQLQAKNLKELILQPESDKLSKEKSDKLKQEIEESGKKYNILSQKQNLSKEEKEKLDEFSLLIKESPQLINMFQYQLQDEFKLIQNQLDLDCDEKIKNACSKSAISKGFTQVYDSSVLVYCSNDLTAAAIEELDKNKK